jgi:hypothetical protein
MADKMIKNMQFFRVKWVAISNQGSTWEPAKNLIGENAKSILDKYLENKAAMFAAEEQRKKDILSGALVATGKPDNPTTNTAVVKGKRSRARSNSSPYSVHFTDWYWDNTCTPAAKRSACKHCGDLVSASSTTNFRSHLVNRHKELLIEELRADEVQNPANVSTLASLRVDYGCVEKFKDSAKRALDEQFVKWCCKKSRGLSIGETDRELKSLLLQASRGRYSPPNRTLALEVMLGMRAAADNLTASAMKALQAERISPSISGKHAKNE